ncbi:4a-hydroxytetrahydrobiopterin dehydratase [Vacuolonema iberomarrocanum]|uniref:4a-hydroxytetrahydrobiopterin dehydratase n=1 Tax=Vacuolonema iberomarrocanum TaxID=3454632 RepID=UPI003F6DF137
MRMHWIWSNARRPLALALLMAQVWLAPSIVQAAEERLSEEAIAQQLQAIPDWSREGDTLLCTYELTDFVDAIAFVNTLVEPAESLGHHPDLMISYNRVMISLTTHDAGGLTALDFALAEAIAQTVAPKTCIPYSQP